MKTADNHFRGFPALWNAAAFYLFLLHLPPALSSLAVAVLIVLTFVPFHVLHPIRVVRLRGLTLSLIAVWAVLAIITLGNDFDVGATVTIALCAIAVYVVGSDAVIRLAEVVQRMIELLTSPEAWAALLTLTALEIVLGIDNVIFLSVIVSRIPQAQAKRARQIGLALALVFRILLLSLLVWLIGLTQAVFTVRGHRVFVARHHPDRRRAVSDRKATHEIHAEVEARDDETAMTRRRPARSSG